MRPASTSATGTPTSTAPSSTAPTSRWTSTAATSCRSAGSARLRRPLLLLPGQRRRRHVQDRQHRALRRRRPGARSASSTRTRSATSSASTTRRTPGTSRATAAYDLGNGFGLIGHVGYQKLKKQRPRRSRSARRSPRDSVTDWKLGVTYDLQRLHPRRGLRRHQPRPDRRHRRAEQRATSATSTRRACRCRSRSDTTPRGDQP